MKKMKLLEICGGFHDQMEPIRVRVPADYTIGDNLSYVLSSRTQKKIHAHLCGIPSCGCGGICMAELELV